ncbi:MAG: hypothetical protein LH702_19200 [Phormidesmis sp. CAN_BIN44]|nr:hypothetical protein [Phormidesmis sp. CAN_BIN44]
MLVCQTGSFTSMTKAELRAYFVAHPNEETAFHAFVDRFTSDASSEAFAPIDSQTDVEAITS